jgi:small subunit ribosomal protein S1
MDLERERINLSMKTLVSNPWDNVLANYSIGEKIEGTVTNLTPFGAFVEIEPGLEGLIHVSEMSWTKRVRHPKEIVTEGEAVEAMILTIDTRQQRISLGLRQTQPDPWSSLPDRYPPGTEVTGPITGITDFGVFMEIEEGIEGLVHISELAHEHIEDITQHFNKGDEVTAVILNIDPVEQRASLSRKRLLPYTATEFEVGTGTPAARGGRKGRRGGRRSSEIDYDYSYAETAPGTRATTKLGDVYADLFAQFGLTEGEEEEQEAEAGAEAPEGAEAAEAAAPETVEAEAEQAESDVVETAPTAGHADEATEVEVEARVDDDVVEAAQEVAEPETAPEKPKSHAAVEVTQSEDAPDAIDTAEAAAMLTAAFREGKRPAKKEEATEEATEKSEGEEAEKSNA